MRKISLALSTVSITFSIILLMMFLIDTETTPTKIFQKSLSSIVEVKASTGDIESFGTAVILSDTELITNFHVVSFTNQSVIHVHNKIEIRFSFSEEYQVVTVGRYDSSIDLVLLIMEDTQGKQFEVNTSGISTGQKVLLMGNGNNLGISLTIGVVSRKEVEISYKDSLNKYVQIDATSTNGVSGGALLDKYGRLIGIVTLRLLDSHGTPIYGYVYAIPISTVLNFTDSGN